jgi:hypothetical protein
MKPLFKTLAITFLFGCSFQSIANGTVKPKYIFIPSEGNVFLNCKWNGGQYISCPSLETPLKVND